MTAIIIEDEDDAASLLRKIIEEFTYQIDVVAWAKNGAEALNAIIEFQPEILFLDVHLDNTLAFEVLDEIDYTKYLIVFTTAHEEYAFNAFKYKALHYILKPYDPDDVMEVCSRLQVAYQQNKLNRKLPESNFVTFKTSEELHILEHKDINHIEANRAYSFIYLTNGKKILVSKSLREVEELLPFKLFFRPHISYLINLQNLSNISKNKSGDSIVKMKNGIEIPLTQKRKTELFHILKQFT